MKLLNGPFFLRISLGLMITLHGLMKLLGGFSLLEKIGSLPPFVPNNEYVHLALGVGAMLIELLGGIFLLLGYRVYHASLAIVFILLCAFAHHLEKIKDFDSLMRNTWPLELAFAFFAIALINKSNK